MDDPSSAPANGDEVVLKRHAFSTVRLLESSCNRSRCGCTVIQRNGVVVIHVVVGTAAVNTVLRTIAIEVVDEVVAVHILSAVSCISAGAVDAIGIVDSSRSGIER